MEEFLEPLELSDSKLATIALAVVASAADWGTPITNGPV
jgi:hypothetical protein